MSARIAMVNHETTTAASTSRERSPTMRVSKRTGEVVLLRSEASLLVSAMHLLRDIDRECRDDNFSFRAGAAATDIGAVLFRCRRKPKAQEPDHAAP
jgi:hypothetical protein